MVADELWVQPVPVPRSSSLASAASAVAVTAAFAPVSTFGIEEEIHFDGDESGANTGWAQLVLRYPLRVICLWALTCACSCALGPRLLVEVKYHCDPEPAMPSGVAKAALDSHFPGLFNQDVESVLFTIGPNVPHWQADPLLGDVARQLDHFAASVNEGHPDMIEATRSWRDAQGGGEPGMSYVSPDRQTWLMQLVWQAPRKGGYSRRDFDSAAEVLIKLVNNLNIEYEPLGISIAITGPHALRQVVQHQARRDVGWHAVMFLPIACLAIHLHLWKSQLLLLPLLCSLMSLVLSFALGFIAASFKTMDANVPTLMAFLSISLSIDWSFFILARFKEESNRGASHEDAILTSLLRTGTNVALSGLLIIACLMCMLIMPTAIASNAVGGCLTVVSALTCNLTLLPACLVACPSFFSIQGGRQGLVAEPSSTREIMERQALFEADGASPSRVEDSTEAACSPGDFHGSPAARHIDFENLKGSDGGALTGFEAKVLRFQHASWYLWAVLVTTFPCNVITFVCVCAVFAPATLRLRDFVPAVDDSLFYPPASPAVIANMHLHNKFVGKLQSKSQMFILIEANNLCTTGVKNNDYFDSSCAFAKDILTLSQADRPILPSNFMSIFFFGTENESFCLPWRFNYKTPEEAGAGLRASNASAHFLLTGTIMGFTVPPSPSLYRFEFLYKELWSRCVSADGKSSLIVIQLPWDMMSWVGFEMIRNLRQLIASDAYLGANLGPQKVENCKQLNRYEISKASVWLDYVDVSVTTLPFVILLACVVTMPFIGLTFRSVVAPFKLSLTVLLPLTWVYGIALLCFDDGIVDDVSWAASFRSSGGLYWMVPCSTSMLLLALAMDYNVFYFGRVYEFRKAGFTDVEAIRQGLAATGPVITCAGAIFAVEFSGLLFSETVVNRQGGFVVVVGILLDTFVVRSCLMPALLSLGADRNWWPSSMPLPNTPLHSPSGSQVGAVSVLEVSSARVAIARPASIE